MSGYHKRDPETFPVKQLKRVDRPTTFIDDNKVQRISECDSGFMLARRGRYGPTFKDWAPQDPLSTAEACQNPPSN